MERYPDDPRPAPDLSAGPIKTVGVVSTGVIGASFVALFLKHNLRVLVCSPSGSPESAPRLAAYLARVWPSLGAHPAASPSNYDFVGPSFDVRHYAELDFVQECAPERPELKRALLARLDAGLALAGRPGVVVASSSSGMVPGALAADCEHHPGRVLVGHPFNPPHLVPLVEVVPHPGGSPAASQAAFAFYRALGRRPVLVRKETPGFVANRLQVALLREAFSLVLDGVVSAEELGRSRPHLTRGSLRSHLEAGAGLWRVSAVFLFIHFRGGGSMLTCLCRYLCDRGSRAPLGALRPVHDQCARGRRHQGWVQAHHHPPGANG